MAIASSHAAFDSSSDELSFVSNKSMLLMKLLFAILKTLCRSDIHQLEQPPKYKYCHDKDTSPLRTSTHNLKPPSPVLTRVTTIVRVNQNKRPTDQNKKSGDPNPRKQSWGTIPNSEYSFDRGENPSPRRERGNRRRCYVILITRPAVVRTTNIVIII
ncbi:hypothetical protein ABEB36_013949 [Hypothenemus hampei]|uniref:Uncharacterized protein n=1 Tax=Hypothenemus hampei TaxID=57062 RepID=A0ABD1E5S5_HYPHA